MRTRGISLMRKENGQGVVEFALILPFLIILLMGILQFGLIFRAYLSLEAAAREGARAASVQETTTQVDSAVQNAAAGLNSSDLTIQISPATTQLVVGDSVTVTLTYSMPVVVTLFQGLLGQNFTMSTYAVMRVE